MKLPLADKLGALVRSTGLDAADALLLAGLALLEAGATLTWGLGPALILAGAILIAGGVVLAWLRREGP